MREYHVLNLGAGVHSSCLFLLAREPDPDLHFDVAIFADTQEVSSAVYDHLNLPVKLVRGTLVTQFAYGADGSKDLGLGPAGEYRWFVHYYRGFADQANVPTRWKVRIKHDGKVDVVQGRLAVKDSRTKEYVLKIEPGPGRESVRNRRFDDK